MLISCEKCSTTYVLDERLIPPGGAPVQCTRCSHVFIALPAAPGQEGKTLVGPSAPAVGGQVPAAGPKTTQMFGAASAAAAAADKTLVNVSPGPPPGRSATQMFGAVSQSSPRAPVRAATQVFGSAGDVGASPAAQAPPRSATQVFGVANSGAVEATAQRVPTQVFGAASAGTEIPPRTTTQVFGTAGAGPATTQPQRTATHVFGAASSPAPEFQSRTTQVFGVGGAPPAPAPVAPEGAGSVRSTQMFGVVGQSGPQLPVRSATQMFGAVGATTAPARTTQMFGAVSGPAAPRSATQVFGGAGVPASADGAHDASAANHAPAGPTGFNAEAGLPASPSGSRVADHALPRRSAMGTEPQTDPEQAKTDTVPILDDESTDSPAVKPASVGPLVQSAPSSARRVPVELPPEPPSARHSSSIDDSMLELQAGLRRRNRLALLSVLAVLCAAGGFLTVRALFRARPSQPAAAIAARDEAAALIRRDDPAALAQAIARLQQLAAEHPTFIDARADLVMALAFQLDDARLPNLRLKAVAEELTLQVARLKEARSPADWESRVNAMIDQIAAIKAKTDPMDQRIGKLDEELNAAFRALNEQPREVSSQEELAVLRAQAVYAGVKGDDRAITLSERYRLTAQDADDGWGRVAYAEYATMARVAPDTLAQAQESLEELRAKDSTFLRAYVLAGRLAWARKSYDAALSALEAAASLNPKHETAKRLLAWVQEDQRASSAKSAPPPSP